MVRKEGIIGLRVRADMMLAAFLVAAVSTMISSKVVTSSIPTSSQCCSMDGKGTHPREEGAPESASDPAAVESEALKCGCGYEADEMERGMEGTEGALSSHCSVSRKWCRIG